MNLVWIAILAAVAGDHGSTSVRPSVHPSSTISASHGHGPRPSQAPSALTDGDARDVDENEPTWILDLDVTGSGLDDLLSGIRQGTSNPPATTPKRPSRRPSSFPLRC